MTKAEKQLLLNSKTVAYYSGFNGIEIKDIRDEEVYFVAGAFGGGRTVHKSKINYTNSGSAYFNYNGTWIRLDECLRT